MNLGLTEANAMLLELKRLVSRVRTVDVGVFPPALLVEPVARRLEDSRIVVGTQNIYSAGFGAFTGETSTDMLASVGATWSLIGHSERRTIFNETSKDTNRKLTDVLNSGLSGILCIGETLEEREADKTFGVLEEQLSVGLTGIEGISARNFVIAYEPVWAIGTGKTASPAQVGEVHSWIRSWLVDFFGSEIGSMIRIQYGGSVNDSNARELLSVEDVDGALVGGASLKAEAFANIVKAAL